MNISSARLTIIVLFALVVALFAPQLVNTYLVHCAKEGRAVDAGTGNGLADAYVIAFDTYIAQSFVHGSAYEHRYRIVTRTDKDGYFHVPSTWSTAFLRLPFSKSTETWQVTAYLPGHVLQGDEASLDAFDAFGQPTRFPLSIVSTPIADWRGLYLSVAPLRLQKTILTDRQAIHYFKYIARSGESPMQPPVSKDALALKKLGFETLAPAICGKGNATIDQEEGASYLAIAADEDEFMRTLRRLEPGGFQDVYHHPLFHADNVCAALNAGTNHG